MYEMKHVENKQIKCVYYKNVNRYDEKHKWPYFSLEKGDYMYL